MKKIVVLLFMLCLNFVSFDCYAQDVFKEPVIHTKPGSGISKNDEQKISEAIPIGMVIVWTKEVVPDGWLECNGQLVNVNSYPKLAALMSSVPDYRDRFLQGKNGQAVGTKIEAGLPNITGEVSSDTASNGNAAPSFAGSKDNGVAKDSGAIQLTKFGSKQSGSGFQPAHGYYGFSFNASRSNPIYGKSDTVQPSAVIVKYIIKAK